MKFHQQTTAMQQATPVKTTKDIRYNGIGSYPMGQVVGWYQSIRHDTHTGSLIFAVWNFCMASSIRERAWQYNT